MDGARVVVVRSRLVGECLAGSGGMISIAEPEGEALARAARWGDRLGVAAVNGPSATVVSGEPEALEELLAECEDAGVRARRIPVDYASHSAQVELIRDRLRDELSGIRPRTPDIPFYSTVDGDWVRDASLDGEYWYRNLRHQVGFDAGVRALAEHGFELFVEVSPHPVLTMNVQDSAAAVGRDCVAVGSLRRDDGGLDRMVLSMGEAYAHGAPVDFATLFVDGSARRIDLPTYAFQRTRYWPEEPDRAGDVTTAGVDQADHPLLGAVLGLAEGGDAVFTGRLSLAAHPWLADHSVSGTVLLPGTAVVELAVRAGDEVGCEIVDELVVEQPLVVPAQDAVRVQVTVSGADGAGRRPVTVHSRPDERDSAWTRHATGFLAQLADAPPDPDPGPWPPPGADPVDLVDFYRSQEERGYDYGPVFRGLQAAWMRDGEVFAEVALPAEEHRAAAGFGLHPALLDAALHATAIVARERSAADGPVLLPFAWNRFTLHASGATRLRVRASTGDGSVSLELADATGAPVASLDSLVFRPIDTGALGGADRRGAALYRLDWVPVPVTPPTAGAPWLAGVEDVRALAASVLSGAAAPAAVLVDISGAEPVDAAVVRESTARVLEVLQAFLAEPALEASRLVLVTRRAEDGDLAAAAACGLARSAQAEYPDRIVLVDSDEVEPPAVWDAGEPQLRVRSGAVSAPRLARMPAGSDGEPFSAEGTVLITGGTGSLGAALARHLVSEHGVRHLLLVSRRGPAAPGADALHAELTRSGAQVTIAACDVADRQELLVLLDAIPGDRPLTGVVHAAGVLDDGVLAALDEDRIEAVFRPKVDAAMLLDELTRPLEITAFVLFSSGAGIFGTPGQGNYAAANAALDALARRRRAEGVPAVSLAWGLWEQDTALTGRLTGTDRSRMAAAGVRPLTVDEGLALFDAGVRSAEPVVVAAHLDLAALRRRAGELPALLRGLVRVPRPAAARDDAGDSLGDRLVALPDPERQRVLLELVRTESAAVLGHPTAEGVDGARAFKEIGFDSLTAVELRNRLVAATGVRLPATLVFDHPTPAALAERLREDLLGRESVPVRARSVISADDPIVVVGVGCRFPGADSPEGFWESVRDGVDAVSGFPVDRGWDLGSLFDSDPDSSG
ncbi:SDR family NAD(P)-dependent oxidoreductase, partial [Saccharopolyspora sp. NPDC002578]